MVSMPSFNPRPFGPLDPKPGVINLCERSAILFWQAMRRFICVGAAGPGSETEKDGPDEFQNRALSGFITTNDY